MAVGLRRLRPTCSRRSRSRSLCFCGTVVDSESPKSLVQDTQIPSDSGDDCAVWSLAPEDLEGAHRNVRLRFEELEFRANVEDQRPQGSETVDSLEYDLTAADSDTDSLAGASQMGTTESNGRAGQPSRRRLLLINGGIPIRCRGKASAESESEVEGVPSEDEVSEDNLSEEEEVVVSREEAESIPDILFVPQRRSMARGFASMDMVDLGQVYEVRALVMKSVPGFGAWRC